MGALRSTGRSAVVTLVTAATRRSFGRGRSARGKLASVKSVRSSSCRAWVLASVAWLGLGCAAVAPNERSLHEVDGQVVSSSPPPPAAYEAYLRARLALESDPPRLDVAQRSIERAIRYDPRDPHLWTTRAEIEERAGERERAAASARRALAIRPGYPPAQEVLARLEGGAVEGVEVAAEREGAGSGEASADAGGRAAQP